MVGVDVDDGDDDGLSGLSWMPTKSGMSHISLFTLQLAWSQTHVVMHTHDDAVVEGDDDDSP